eukprot:COSAG06_NODE_2241_length_7269_cov_9.419944_5_plen_299_part_00
MPIATGNWGCGVFGGDIFLKALLQSLAATVADRPRLDYYTVGDAGLTEQIRHLFEQIAEKTMTVGDIWELFGQYSRKVGTGYRKRSASPRLSFEGFLVAEGLLMDPDAEDTEEAEEEEAVEEARDDSNVVEGKDAGDGGNATGTEAAAAAAQGSEMEPAKQPVQQTLDTMLPKHAARAGRLEKAAHRPANSLPMRKGDSEDQDQGRELNDTDPAAASEAALLSRSGTRGGRGVRGRRGRVKRSSGDGGRHSTRDRRGGAAAAAAAAAAHDDEEVVPDSEEQEEDPAVCKKRPRSRRYY